MSPHTASTAYTSMFRSSCARTGMTQRKDPPRRLRLAALTMQSRSNLVMSPWLRQGGDHHQSHVSEGVGHRRA